MIMSLGITGPGLLLEQSQVGFQLVEIAFHLVKVLTQIRKMVRTQSSQQATICHLAKSTLEELALTTQRTKLRSFSATRCKEQKHAQSPEIQ